MSVSKRRTAGAISLIGGLLLVILGSAWAPANATPKDDENFHKVTICHRTNSVTNPYTVNTVDISSTDGSLGNGSNDHTRHEGPVFDFYAPDAPGYHTTYPTPRNGDQWGDIIPPYTWGTGSSQVQFPGMNWTTEGQAIYNNGCSAPDGSSSSSSSSTTSSSSSSSSDSSSCASSSDSSSSNSSSQQTSSQQTSSQQTSSQQTSSQQTSSQQTSSQQTSSEETSSQPSVSASSEQTSSDVVAPSSQENSPSDSVGGVKVNRPGAQQLPRTGMDPGFMLMMGGALVVAGVLMLRYSDTASA